MKVIMLDIDGVLNEDTTPTRTKSRVMFIDEEKLLRLKRIVDETGAKIVLSSTWRYDRNDPEHNGDFLELQEAFRQVGLEFYSYTPVDAVGIRRGMEIKAWLGTHPEVDRYIILDDELFDYAERGLLPRLVKPSFCDGGLTEELAEEAIGMLNSEAIPERKTAVDILLEKLTAITEAWRALPDHREATPDIPLQWAVDPTGMLWLDQVWICPASYVNMSRLDECAQDVQESYFEVPIDKEFMTVILIPEFGEYKIHAIERHGATRS